ncbi:MULTISPECIES: ABC transporter ATP-binding protein [unclassified Sinorhizobium]|uniref:ABC transporter ATP-binding protein n=1 Tax=unclassified Sinorhizobium TaxID=2613772 RepID=UPI0024C299FF|nr:MULTISPECIES: ABC transporter ATP-binding protein [unclassified Sinorhizobium]MDK1374734.1 ABC transporter ATP-binding protein [Sinorhizobium sp. 6-70]MDK1479082.1 ABC transporter ATP-binding protein [Sinorhizobium sp. 6-117]
MNALIDITLRVEQGEAVAIMGPSGSGKSTLLNILGCLDVPSSGTYMLDNTDVSSLSMSQLAALRGQVFGFVFQNFNLLARATAFENVELPLIYAGGWSRAARRDRAMQLLELVGLIHRASHLPSQLSGGEQQRVAIARALANKPKIVMADEPTGALDTAVSRTILNMLYEINETGVTLLLVTHDPAVASSMHRIITLKDGRIISDASSTSGQLEAAQ